MNNGFEKVYPFTTEKIDSYFNKLDLEDKKVLTVGSSGDQVFNALTLGANKVVLYDINPNTIEFYKLKKDIILNSKREEVYNNVLSIDNINYSEDLFSFIDLEKMNTYMKNDDNYRKLQERLLDDDVSFVIGDIFEMPKYLDNEKFDRIIFSNILQYIDLYKKSNNITTDCFLKEKFNEWIKYLDDDGILQLMYYYCLKVNINDLCNIYTELYEYPLNLSKLEEDNPLTDAVVLYKKR